jgi:hypothetical protein
MIHPSSSRFSRLAIIMMIIIILVATIVRSSRKADRSS